MSETSTCPSSLVIPKAVAADAGNCKAVGAAAQSSSHTKNRLHTEENKNPKDSLVQDIAVWKFRRVLCSLTHGL